MIGKLTAVTIVLVALAIGSVYAAETLTPTDRNVDLFGYATDFALQPGDVVSAYTASGVLCGQCTVQSNNAYGFLHVYGDDPATPQVEGARPGERITLTVNGAPVEVAGPDQPVWTRDADKLHVDLEK